jgi:hypothetical protein
VHLGVAARPGEEPQRIRDRLDIEILDFASGTPPKLVTTFLGSSFLDFIMERIGQPSDLKALTPIQQQVWPAALHGHELIGIAETGSGKTLAYILCSSVVVVGLCWVLTWKIDVCMCLCLKSLRYWRHVRMLCEYISVNLLFGSISTCNVCALIKRCVI